MEALPGLGKATEWSHANITAPIEAGGTRGHAPYVSRRRSLVDYTAPAGSLVVEEDSAAARIASITSSGLESMATWLLSAS
jgi:hypothetical protein